MNKIEDQYGLRNAPRVRVRVNVAPGNGCLIAGQLFPHGESTQVVYQDHLDAVIRKTQTDEDRSLVEQCERVHANRLAQWKRSNPGKNEREYPSSIVHEFYAMTGKGIPPVASMEIVEELSAPDTAESRADNNIKALAMEIAKAISAQGNSKSK